MKKNIVKNLEEIVESRGMTEEAKKLVSRRIISNFAFSVSFIILILAYRLASFTVPNNIAEIIYSISSLVFILLTIITFELGYKKDDEKFAITGIELLIFSLLSLFSPYIFYVFNYKYITAFLCIGTLYYIVKIIIIYNKETNKAFKENNDISVIIKKESQDKLAKKFGKVKNDEIKTVITGEKPKKTQTKKTTAEKPKKTQTKKTTAEKPKKTQTKKTTAKNTKTKTTSTKSNPTKKTTEKKTTTKKTTQKSTTSKTKTAKSKNTTSAKPAPKTKTQNTTKTKSAPKTKTQNTTKSKTTQKAAQKTATQTTNAAKKTNTSKSKTTSKKENNE